VTQSNIASWLEFRDALTRTQAGKAAIQAHAPLMNWLLNFTKPSLASEPQIVWNTK
jgi:hypothetical protein